MLNKALLQGRFTADPELRSTQSGVSVTTFALAVNRDFKKEGQPDADFINCTAWRSTAEFVCKYFQKGMQAVVDGSIQTRSYTDKDGNKRTAFEVVVDNIYFADSKKEDRPAPTSAQGQTQSYTFPENFEPQQQGFSPDQYKPTWEDVDTDDLPF
jgi:single-strand DNA-binding protein